MAQADAHDRFARQSVPDTPGLAFHHFPQDVDGLSAYLWISGAVAQENPVTFQFGIVIIPRNPQDLDVPGKQAPDDVVFAAAVDQDRFFPGRSISDGLRQVGDGFTAGNFSDKVVAVIISGDWLILFVAIHRDAAAHDPLFPQDLSQGARVDARDGGDSFPFQPFIEAFFRIPMAVFLTVIGNDQSSDKDVAAFKMLLQTILFPSVRRDTIVADEGKGGDEDLARVRGVGQIFWITGHGRVEDHFSGDVPNKTEGFSLETGAVFQG